MSHFECREITKYYDGIPVVQSISVSLEKGEHGCLLGPSGVGKTTLMSVLAGVDQPDCGKVFLSGTDITARPGSVSYMLQKDLLLPYKTLIDNVCLPLVLRGVNKKEARHMAAQHLVDFGLSGCEKMYPYKLSGGMRQRAALLRTYLSGREIMLMDEPFSALDTVTKRQMHQWYLDIIKKMKTTTLLITHDIDEALILSDKVYILGGVPGRVVMQMDVSPYKDAAGVFIASDEFNKSKQLIIDAIESAF